MHAAIASYLTEKKRKKYVSGFKIATIAAISEAKFTYSEVPLIRPLMVLVKSGLNSEQVRPICTLKKKCILVQKHVVLTGRVVLILNGHYGGTLLYM